MTKKMSRGKHQVLFNYLPGRTIEFERFPTISIISNIRGFECREVNKTIVLNKISEEVRAWHEEFRPTLRDAIINDHSRFVLLEPQAVEARMYPKIFRCDNCGNVVDYSHSNSLPQSSICNRCNSGRLFQLRFVQIHRCGLIRPLKPPYCSNCKSSNNYRLDFRNSTRFANFKWICNQCGDQRDVIPDMCNCNWPDNTQRRMEISVHRAHRTFYPHIIDMLNIPQRELDAFINYQDWPVIAAAKYLDLESVQDIDIKNFNIENNAELGISIDELNDLATRRRNKEITDAEFANEIERLGREKSQSNLSINEIIEDIERETNMPISIWRQASQELIETLLTYDNVRNENNIFENRNYCEIVPIAENLGFSKVALVSDFPIITATYAYSRVDFNPNDCRLVPFPEDQYQSNRYPIYVDEIQADAIIFKLNPERVIDWLIQNGFSPQIANISNPDRAYSAYFVNLFNGISFKQTIMENNPEARMVFGLIHTLSHIFIKKAAVMCGLEQPSLAEYILPRSLMFAIYCNHRYGKTIGALTALFEQNLRACLLSVQDSKKCIYDPVCRENGGYCHSCAHLPETSCRFFNLNLSRNFLFGGEEQEIGQVRRGFIEN